MVAAAADVESPLKHSEPSRLRLPCHPVRKTALHLHALVALHPAVERRENLRRSPTYSPRSSRDGWTGDAREERLILRHGDTRALFRQRLSESREADSNFLSALDQL